MRSVPWHRLRAVVISLFLLSTVLAEPASAAARVEGQAVADRPTASPAVPTAVAKFLPRGARIYADPAEAGVLIVRTNEACCGTGAQALRPSYWCPQASPVLHQKRLIDT